LNLLSGTPKILSKTNIHWANQNKPFTVTIPFLSNPHPIKTDFKIPHYDTLLKPTKSIEIEIENRTVDDWFHNVSVPIEGYIAVLKFAHFTKHSDSDLALVIENNIGITTYYFQLKLLQLKLLHSKYQNITMLIL